MSHAITEHLPVAPREPGDIPAAHPGAFVAVIADTDQDAAHQLAVVLLEHNIHAIACPDGAEALLQAGLLQPNVLILSAALPVLDTVTVIGVLRRRRDTPVVVSVDRGDTRQAAAALAAGATACLSRPYRIQEVLPLLHAACPELSRADRPPIVTWGPLSLNDDSHEVRLDGQLVQLPLREYDLLHLLMQRAGRVVSHAEIRTQVWGAGYRGNMNTVVVHIKRLRRRLGEAGHPELIQTVRGVGYKLQPANPDTPPPPPAATGAPTPSRTPPPGPG